jgi:hypothetical protein
VRVIIYRRKYFAAKVRVIIYRRKYFAAKVGRDIRKSGATYI